MKYLEKYHCPGKVRQLHHEIENICILTDGIKIAPDALDANFFDERNELEPIEDVEKRHIQKALRFTKTLSEAAKKIKMPKTTLLRRLNQYGISKK